MTVRRFQLVAFLAFCLLVAVSTAVTFVALHAEQTSGLVINLAGRQRMLVQKMTLAVLGVRTGAGPAYSQVLYETAHEEFEPTLGALIAGGEAPYTEGRTVTLPPARDPEILARLERVRATWAQVHPAIHALLVQDRQSAAFGEATERLDRLLPVLLTQVDEVVRAYETAAARDVARLRVIQIVAFGVGAALLILVLYLTRSLILKPIARLEEAVRRIGTGDLTMPVPPVGLGEVSHLAEGLDEMRQRLAAAAEAQAALRELSRILLEAKDERATAEHAVQVAASVLHVEFSTLVLPDAEGRLVIHAARGWPQSLVRTLELGRGRASQTGYTIEHGIPVVVEDYASETAFTVPAVVSEHGIVSGLSVPMTFEGRVIGAMLVHSRVRRKFDEHEIGLLSLIANQTAVALEKIRLLTAARRRADELEALRATVADILAEHDLSRLLQATLERAVMLLGAGGGELGIYDEARAELLIVGSHNMGEDYTGTRMALDEGAMGRAAQTREPLIVNDYPTWEGRSPQYTEGPWHGVMAAPLIFRDRLIGVIGIVDSDPARRFTAADLRLLALFAQQASIAIENARLLEKEREQRQEAQQRARRQAALVRLSADLAATLDEEEICHRVVQGLHDTLGYAYQGVFLVDEATGDRVLRAGVGWPDAPPDWRIPPGQGVSERALLDGQLHYTPDVTQDPNYVPGLNSGAEVDVPIHVGGKAVGVLVVESREPNAFGPEDFEVLKAAANQAGIAISNARLLQISQRRAQEAETLRQAGAVVAATLQQDEAIQRILEQLERVVPYDSASVQLLREGYVEIVGGRGWADPTAVVGLRFPVPGDNPNTVVIQERRPYILNDALAAHAPFREEPHSHIRSWLGVPLIVGDRVIGMLSVDSTQPNYFTADHVRLVAAFADQVAIAIENARLYTEAEQRANELGCLYAAAQDLAASLEPRVMLEHLARHLTQALDATSGYILEVDLEHSTLTVLVEYWSAAAAPAERIPHSGRTYLLGDYPATAKTLASERVLSFRSDSPELTETERRELAAHGIRSELLVPIVVRGQGIGVAQIWESRTPRVFTPAEIRLARTLAQHAAGAIENARLFQAEQRGREEVTALLEIMQVAGSSLELKQVLKHIAQQTARICQAHRCSILLLDDTGEYLQPVMFQFADGHADPHLWEAFRATSSDPLDAVPLFHRAIRERRAALLDDPTRTDLVPLKWTRAFGIQKLLVIPLTSHDQVIGLLGLDHTDPDREFTPDQINLALTIAGQVTNAITNARLYAEAEAHAKELAMLARVGEALTRAQTADETLQLVLAEAVRLVNRPEGSIILVEPETGTLYISTYRGLPPEEVQAFNARRLGANEGTFADSIGRGEMVEVADTASDPRVVRDYTDTFPGQLTNVPLKTGHGVIGVIALNGLPGDDRARRLLRALADLAAAAIDRAELLEETRRRAEQLRTLHQAGRALTADLRLEVVLQTLVESAQHLTGARYASLTVLDADGNVDQFYTAGLTEAERQRIGDPPQGRGLLGILLSGGAPLRIADLASDPRATGFPSHHPVMKTFLGVPLVARGKLVGALFLSDKVNGHPFTQEDENLVVGLAADAAIAIENAQLFGEVQQLAITDELTGLYNRRHFFELAEREFDRARRYGRPLATIMLDVDHFKQVNDTYGHAVGDQVLRALAKRCRENVRDVDLLARYGGEEFIVLLPESTLEGAYEVAQRLCGCVAEVPLESGRGSLTVTISVGVAAITQDCVDLETLLNRADAALYAAKRSGRNRVEALGAE